MWIFYAADSAFFTGITAILAKCGIRKTDSGVATAIRTIIVLLFSWLMVLVTGTEGAIRQRNSRTFLFPVLSGLTILLALVSFREGLSGIKILSVILIGAGTILMIDKKIQKRMRKKAADG